MLVIKIRNMIGTTTYRHKQSGRLIHRESKVLKTDTHALHPAVAENFAHHWDLLFATVKDEIETKGRDKEYDVDHLFNFLVKSGRPALALRAHDDRVKELH